MSNDSMSVERSRDDFSPAVKEMLAKRSGYICAYPGCKRMTVAGSDDRKSGITLTGIAAHITAASKNGPRYDPNMSPEERASESNGIWTCQIHGKLIDDNPSKCTVEELRRWKSQHEKWVFERVESGKELFNKGINRISFAHIGVFPGEHTIPLGRHNVLVGLNVSGKTTFCEIIAAFSGGTHWIDFNQRFAFNESAAKRSFIAIFHQTDQQRTSVKLSPQLYNPATKRSKKTLQHIHVEVNGCPSIDWPRSLFKTVYFKDQLYRLGWRDPKDTFVKAIRYLACVFFTQEELIWDAFRDELFATSLFGYRFHRTGRRRVNILVPDGRDFYLPHGNLSFTELQMAFVEIAVKFVLGTPKNEHWMFIFDNSFFGRMDVKNQALLFKKLTEIVDLRLQTLFCLHSTKDAEALKDVQSYKWVNATHIQELTIHSFL